MPGKGKKKGKSKKPAAAGGGGGDEEGAEEGNGGPAKKGKKGKKGGKGGKSSKFQGDILSDSAMENAYYICHNLMDVLRVRGFPWPELGKKKKKGKK